MTQPSRIHEVLQEMEADSQLGEQLRAKILGDELLKLPAEVRETNRRIDSVLEQMRQENRQVREQVQEQLEEMRQENRRAQERFQESLEEMRRENRQARKQVQEQLVALNKSNQRAELRMDRLEQDRSILKNMTTRWEAARYARTLARELNADYVRSLNSDDLERIVGATLTGGARRSFVRADLVIEGWGQWEAKPGTVYIAAEVSYTAAPRDAARALRHSRTIADATGRPCRPVVISVRNTDEVTEQVESGHLHWYQLEDRDLDYDEGSE